MHQCCMNNNLVNVHSLTKSERFLSQMKTVVSW